MKKYLILLGCFIIAVITVYNFIKPNFNLKEDKLLITEDLSKYFKGYDGCFVMYDTNKEHYIIYNKTKSLGRVSPCSTFKIINTLIGLEEKVVNENTVFKWDGTIYSIKSWNQDLDLASAIKHSAFWYYQKIASSVGKERMKKYLDNLEYGNSDISGGITQFWQQSSLLISPKEQVDILRKIYFYEVPFSRSNIDILKRIIQLSNENEILLSGKTGTGLSKSAKFVCEQGDEYVNGWFIGYVEKKGNTYFFATNISADKNATGSQANEITREILKDKGLL